MVEILVFREKCEVILHNRIYVTILVPYQCTVYVCMCVCVCVCVHVRMWVCGCVCVCVNI